MGEIRLDWIGNNGVSRRIGRRGFNKEFGDFGWMLFMYM